MYRYSENVKKNQNKEEYNGVDWILLSRIWGYFYSNPVPCSARVTSSCASPAPGPLFRLLLAPTIRSVTERLFVG